MTTGTSNSSDGRRRAYDLDALRGLAILGMVLSGQMPFGEVSLPAWMYHAQVPPPDHKWVATLPGITWVDLVFPFFLFALGAAIPLALTRRLEQGGPKWRVAVSIAERGLLLAFFALYVEAIQPHIISEHPSTATWLIALLGFALLVVGLKARWLVGTTLSAFALCALGWRLMSKPATATERLFRALFNWAIYWLVLGLFFEPYEGGIKKDRATMSYYFVTAGCAICVLIGFSILIDVFRRKRWVQLLVENGQNSMIAYAGINNLVIPLLALTQVNRLLAGLNSSPWLAFAHGAIVTLLLALSVSLFTKRRIFWRT